MCGRFVLTNPVSVLETELEIQEAPWLPGLEPRYNIAPTQNVLVASQPEAAQSARLSMMRWGLVPHWASPEYLSKNLFNARSETLESKPSFRDSFANRRCLILADGFYEWQKREGDKQGYFFHLPDRRLFAFAGLWDRWQSPDNQSMESCTIITTSALPRLEQIHPRQPVILPREQWETWLKPDLTDSAQLMPMLSNEGGQELGFYPVGSYVNRAANDDPQCLEAAPIQRSLFD